MSGRGTPFVAGALMLILAAVGSGLEVPYLAGRINDQADLLSDAAEQQLEGSLQQLEEETGAQVAVLTIPTLEGDPIEDFSMRVVETWKLGREDVDDGVLILIARDDRRMRIEVGYGLEGALTDAQAGRIIRDVMTPRFREGDFDGGVSGAVEVVSAAVRGEPLPLPEEQSGRGGGGNPIAVLAMLIMGLPFISGALQTRGAAGWILYLFLTPFFFAIPASVFGTRIGLHIGLLWLLGFPILRLVWPKPPPGSGGSKAGSFWGPFVVGGGGGGGGFSGGGFSGGGGSFGGGGASGGW